MYKVQKSHFIENDKGGTLIASLTENGEVKCMVITVTNPADSENIGQTINAVASLKRLSTDFKDACELKLDIDLAVDYENHKLTIRIKDHNTELSPTEFNLY